MTPRDEQGTAVVEFTWLAVLLMVPLLYIVLAVFEVQRSAFGVSTAARAAGRAFTQSPSEAAAHDRAFAAAALALRDHGLGARTALAADPVLTGAGELPGARFRRDRGGPSAGAAPVAPRSSRWRAAERPRGGAAPGALRNLQGGPELSRGEASRADEGGQPTVMIIGFVIVLVMMVVVVGIEGQQVYTGGLGERGAVDPGRARALVAEYLSSVGAQGRYPRLSTAVVTSGDRVVVRLAAPLDLPLPLPGVTDMPRVSAESASVVSISD